MASYSHAPVALDRDNVLSRLATVSPATGTPPPIAPHGATPSTRNGTFVLTSPCATRPGAKGVPEMASKHKKTGDAGARWDRIVQAVGAAALVAASVDPWVVPMLPHPTITVIVVHAPGCSR